VRLEHTWFETSDTTVLGRILAPDFLHVVPGGQTIDRAEQLAWLAAHPHQPMVHRRFVRLDVRVYEHAALANGVIVATDPAGRELWRSAFTDVFVMRRGRWLAVNAQEDAIAALARIRNR
jgi:Domain of unknown function (DUF4440)